MASYAYAAINAQGLETEGVINAPDLAAAREQLRIKGLLPQSIKEAGTGENIGNKSISIGAKKVKPKSLQIFSRQFATMIEAGLNVVGALVILEEQTDDEALAGVVHVLRQDVEGGLLLSQAMLKHPKVFTRLYVSMVEAGEAAGILDIVLDRVAFQIEKQEAIRRRIKGAMVYPSMVLIFATLVLVGMLMFLVPVFVKIFSDLGGQLPTLTQYVVTASNLLKTKPYVLLLIPGGLWAFFRWKKTEKGRQNWDKFKLTAADEDRRCRAEGRDGALLAHAVDARRGRRRHHQGARDHRADVRQLGGRGCARDRSPEGARGRSDRTAAHRQRRVPTDGRADGEDR